MQPRQHITRDLTDGHRNLERVLTLVRFQLDPSMTTPRKGPT